MVLVKCLSVSLLIIIFATTAIADSSVWKISKGKDLIYLAGTIHILPPSEFPLPSEFQKAYKNSNVIVLEAKLPDPKDTAAQIAMLQHMAYKDGTKLSDVITKKTYQSLSNYLKALGVDLTELNGFKPGFIVSMMAVLEAKKAQISGEGVDAYYAKLAQEANKPTEYLETAAFQLQMLAGMGDGNEDEFLTASLSQMDGFETMIKALISAWRNGDTQALEEIVIAPMSKDDPKSLKDLISDRNRNWLPKIEAMFGDSNTEFVLVGVGHLIGKNSVIQLLKMKGYHIEKL